MTTTNEANKQADDLRLCETIYGADSHEARSMRTAHERMVETAPALAHKAGCSQYWPVTICECQNANWKARGAGNYPSEPNPPMKERDCRDRL